MTSKAVLTPRTGRFSRSSRILSRSDFDRVSAGGQKAFSKHFLILFSAALGPQNRLGLTISRKVDPRAVYRNRLKRRIREWFRAERGGFSGVFDIVIVARKNAAALNFAELKLELNQLLVRAAIRKKA